VDVGDAQQSEDLQGRRYLDHLGRTWEYNIKMDSENRMGVS
jgi:hypothetical protein